MVGTPSKVISLEGFLQKKFEKLAIGFVINTCKPKYDMSINETDSFGVCKQKLAVLERRPAAVISPS